MPVSPELGSPELDTVQFRCNLTRAEQKERFTSLDLLVMLFLMQPRIILVFFASGNIVGSCSILHPPESPNPFLQSCFPAGTTNCIQNNKKAKKEITIEEEANKSVTIIIYSQEGLRAISDFIKSREATYMCKMKSSMTSFSYIFIPKSLHPERIKACLCDGIDEFKHCAIIL